MIVVEGPDGSGKTTLVKRIMDSKLGSELELMPRAVSKDAKSLTKIDDYIEEELGKGFGMRLYDRFALISSRTRRNSARTSSSLPFASAGSSKLQWIR